MNRFAWFLIVVAVFGGFNYAMKRSEARERLALGWCEVPASLEKRAAAMEAGLEVDNISGCIKDDARSVASAEVRQVALASVKAAAPPATLAEARRGFVTRVSFPPRLRLPIPTPPAALFVRSDYTSGVHTMPAFVTTNPGDGKRHPAIVWIGGGDLDGLGDFWTPGPADNDQSASPLREAGLIMMFTTLRGSGNNASRPEYYLGEVDDILAAADHLARLPYVDPDQIYLGGHSSGATLALLVAQSSKRFKSVFALGPAENIAGYPDFIVPPAVRNLDGMEARLRSPIHWMDSIATPTYILEGLDGGNVDSLDALCSATKNPMVHCVPVPGMSHFSLIQPALRVIGARLAIPMPGRPFSIQAGDIKTR